MTREERLRKHAIVYRNWVDKHMGEPGFDPDDGFMTIEQQDDLFRMLDKAIPNR